MNRRKMCWDVNSYQEEAPVTVYDCHGQVREIVSTTLSCNKYLINNRGEISSGNMILITNGWFTEEIPVVLTMILRAGDFSLPGLCQSIRFSIIGPFI